MKLVSVGGVIILIKEHAGFGGGGGGDDPHGHPGLPLSYSY
jgi:hypothetical protein